MTQRVTSVFLCLVVIVYRCTAQDPPQSSGQTPAFTEDERYLDILPLTADNFTQLVLKCKDPWVVIFHDGSMARGWKTMAAALRGIVWVGMVDKVAETELVETLKYDPQVDPEARVYPFGGQKIKQSAWKAVKDPNDARLAVVNSIPDRTQRMVGADVSDFIMSGYHSSPSKFPALFLVDEEDTSATFKALTLRFEKYYNFGRIVKPTSVDLQHLGLRSDFIDTPAIMVLVTPEMDGPRQGGNVQFNAVPYNMATMGQPNYINVMQFLFAVNSQFRHLLPGDNQSDQQIEAEMADIVVLEERRFDITFNGKKMNGSDDSQHRGGSDDSQHRGKSSSPQSKDVQMDVDSTQSKYSKVDKDEL